MTAPTDPPPTAGEPAATGIPTTASTTTGAWRPDLPEPLRTFTLAFPLLYAHRVHLIRAQRRHRRTQHHHHL